VRAIDLVTSAMVRSTGWRGPYGPLIARDGTIGTWGYGGGLVGAPGWYPDPGDTAFLRYFDGGRWTDERVRTEHLSGNRPEREPAAAYAPARNQPTSSVAHLDPSPTNVYAPPTREDDWLPPTRHASGRTRRRRRPALIVAGAAVLAGGLIAGWFVLHKSSSSSITYGGKKVDDPAGTLRRAEESLDALVVSRNGVKSADTRCYFAIPAQPPKDAKKSDVDGALRCGPVLFVDGNPARTYLSFTLTGTAAGKGAVTLMPAAQPVSDQPGPAPVGLTFRRPDGLTPPLAAGLAVPAPPPARADTLVAADLGSQALRPAPRNALMVSLRGGVRLTEVGAIDRYGTGDGARSAPPGQRLIAFTYTPVPGQVANIPPPPTELGVSTGTGPVRRLPPVHGTQAVVLAVPAKGQAAVVLNADGVRQTLALPSGKPGSANLAVLRRNRIDAVLAVNKPITINFARPDNVMSLAGRVTVTRALLGYWTDDGTHHASGSGRALLWMDFRFHAPHQSSETGIDAPLLRLTPAGGQSITAKDVDPGKEVFAVFDVPATFTRGTVTITGTERGNPTITVMTPVGIPVLIR
jgi:hypothetical protein